MIQIPEIIGGILMILVSVGIVFFVLMQESPKGDGMSALTGSDSYFSKNQSRTRDALFARSTKVLAIAFFVITIVVYTIDKIFY